MLSNVNLISGSGSTSVAVYQAEKPGGYLHRLVKTVGLISSDPNALGIKRMLDLGFPERNIHVVRADNPKYDIHLLHTLDIFGFDYFHQLGWMPRTPQIVLDKYRGLNQHLGPGKLCGIRRLAAHRYFCKTIGENRPLPIFCQEVAFEWDGGDVIYGEEDRLNPDERLEDAAARLLPKEHAVQIEALERLATNTYTRTSVPTIFQGEQEAEIMKQARQKARRLYP